MNFSLTALGVLCALGNDKKEILNNATIGNINGMIKKKDCVPYRTIFFGEVKHKLPKTLENKFNTRCNQLLLASLEQIKENIIELKYNYKPSRIGIVLGSSNTGVQEAQQNINKWLKEKKIPQNFSISHFELGLPSDFLKYTLKLSGPSYTISTACSSSAKAFISAKNLIANDICDAVIVGGVDSFCSFALNGFASLEALSEDLTNPFSKNRTGINLGEGVALFIMEKDKNGIQLLGAGESSDAYHLTKPEPSGEGAKDSILKALKNANLNPSDIDYINLHGTGTIYNDLMESKAIYSIFKDTVPCSSSKPLTGHILGGSGAVELALCYLLISNKDLSPLLIPHIFDGELDLELSPINLIKPFTRKKISIALSNSFAFGGSNATLIVGEV